MVVLVSMVKTGTNVVETDPFFSQIFQDYLMNRKFKGTRFIL